MKRWLHVLLLLLLVTMCVELVLFEPKSAVTARLDTVRETAGSIVGVDLDAGEGREYMRALLLGRYRLVEVCPLPAEGTIQTANGNLYDVYAYEIVMPDGTITLYDVKMSGGAVVLWAGWLMALVAGAAYHDSILCWLRRRTRRDKSE